ncbi:1-deoxy-D-xylulose-5-phosphate synthase [Lachnospiraceae bacterium NK3A20]|nr:1-deoxy-D-xylulose-5-phosphate synthase [Lachnospiraceae bacterium NK3A20]
MEKLLDKINKTGDIRRIDPSQYDELAAEIRQFLIENVSKTGGHLASNLGTVELTMGLHLALHFPQDRVVWDVGHQCYTHKILTGRKDGFEHLRQYGGMAGFPKRAESNTDSFDTGHASNSISAGLGLVKARDLQGEKRTIVSVIGDGALTGGLAYEGLNNAASLKTNFIIILNDNNHSISDNVGGMHQYLNGIRTSDAYLSFRDKVYTSLKDKNPAAMQRVRKAKNLFKSLFVPGMLFEEMGLTYLGPIDGHDVKAVRKAITEAKRVPKAVVIHVLTKKGDGYLPAEKHPARFHGTVPFEIETGLPTRGSKVGYTDVFSTVMIKMAQRDPKVVAITAAMADGVGLKRFRNIYPDRFFDVGIAEEHAVTFAAGLAVGGLHPVVAVYSTFLQRAFDEIAEDVCMQDLPVVFAIDRAGLVGADGETHQGIMDLSYLSAIPNMVIAAPKNKWGVSDLIKFALKYGHPIAVRYPRGAAYEGLSEFRAPVELGRSEMIAEGSRILLFAAGSMVETAMAVREKLKAKGYDPTVVNARFIRPFDTEMLDAQLPSHELLVTMEENVLSGGFGEHVSAWVAAHHPGQQVLNIAIPDHFVQHGNVDLLKAECGIDADSVTAKILDLMD